MDRADVQACLPAAQGDVARRDPVAFHRWLLPAWHRRLVRTDERGASAAAAHRPAAAAGARCAPQMAAAAARTTCAQRWRSGAEAGGTWRSSAACQSCGADGTPRRSSRPRCCSRGRWYRLPAVRAVAAVARQGDGARAACARARLRRRTPARRALMRCAGGERTSWPRARRCQRLLGKCCCVPPPALERPHRGAHARVALRGGARAPPPCCVQHVAPLRRGCRSRRRGAAAGRAGDTAVAGAGRSGSGPRRSGSGPRAPPSLPPSVVRGAAALAARREAIGVAAALASREQRRRRHWRRPRA